MAVKYRGLTDLEVRAYLKARILFAELLYCSVPPKMSYKTIAVAHLVSVSSRSATIIWARIYCRGHPFVVRGLRSVKTNALPCAQFSSVLLVNSLMIALAYWLVATPPFTYSVGVRITHTFCPQMVANAKAAGDEIAALKMRVMEMEIGTAVAMPAGHL